MLKFIISWFIHAEMTKIIMKSVNWVEVLDLGTRAAHRTYMLRYMGATVQLQLPYREASRKLAYGTATVRLSYHIYHISMAPYGHVYGMTALGSYLIIQMDSLLT